MTYPNLRSKTMIAASLSLLANPDLNRKHAAILVGDPFLDMKEQNSDLHAQLLAEQGYPPWPLGGRAQGTVRHPRCQPRRSVRQDAAHHPVPREAPEFSPTT
ncbi:hypothetical protein [Streptomyces sp. NPDC053367]|uniref:hypothetical protein n=1 Tax=Streptomyces sp. NPDC053367 TaxID=3365700 RepID=UPI0037CF12BF